MRHRRPRSFISALAAALLGGLVLPAIALAGAVITPVPTFPYPSVTMGTQFNASLSLFNNSTGPEAAAGVNVKGENLDLFPSCPDTVIISNDCPTAEAGVFSLSSTGTSGAGDCPPGTWTITEQAPGRFRFTPPGEILLLAGKNCTINFTAVANTMPQFDSNLTSPGTQTNQVSAIDAISPATQLRVRNSGSGQTSVIGAPAPSAGVSGKNAALKISEGCKRIATARVTGDDIKSVTFFVDGKRQAAVTNPPFEIRIKAFRLSAGSHKLTAKVKFTSAADQLSESFRGGFLSCKRQRQAQPKFTG